MKRKSNPDSKKFPKRHRVSVPKMLDCNGKQLTCLPELYEGLEESIMKQKDDAAKNLY